MIPQIRKFYFTQKASGIQRTVFRLGYHHFYIDSFYKYFFKSILFGSSNEAKFKGLVFTFKRIESKVIDMLINGFVKGFLNLAKWTKKIEVGIIDRLVWSVTFGLKMLGDYIRKSQKGLVQNYLWAMLAIISLIILFKILMN